MDALTFPTNLTVSAGRSHVEADPPPQLDSSGPVRNRSAGPKNKVKPEAFSLIGHKPAIGSVKNRHSKNPEPPVEHQRPRRPPPAVLCPGMNHRGGPSGSPNAVADLLCIMDV